MDELKHLLDTMKAASEALSSVTDILVEGIKERRVAGVSNMDYIDSIEHELFDVAALLKTTRNHLNYLERSLTQPDELPLLTVQEQTQSLWSRLHNSTEEALTGYFDHSPAMRMMSKIYPAKGGE